LPTNNEAEEEEFAMRTMKRLLLGVGLLAVSAGVAAAAPAIVQTDLTLRSGPGPRYAPVATLPAGATVDVGGCTGRWCQVVYGDAEGYANRAYLGFGAAAVEPGYDEGYGTNYGYYDPGYTDDYGYYGDYGYPYGGVGIAFGGGYRHGRDYDHDRGDRRNRMGSVATNPSIASRNFVPRNGGMAPQGNANIRAGRNFTGQNPNSNHQNFNASRMSGTVGSGAPVARSTVGSGAPVARSTVGSGAPMARGTVGAGGPMGGGGGARIGGGGGGGGFGGHGGGGGGGGGHGHR
jgi:uncharacterized protein YraI